jgi:hypothetical protein
MSIHDLLQRLAFARCDVPAVMLILPCGHLIYCCDGEQADLLEGLWRAFIKEFSEEDFFELSVAVLPHSISPKELPT